MPERKTARTRAEIAPELLAELNAGTRASATLVEGLAVDFARLAQSAFPQFPPDAIALIQESATRGITRRMELVGALILMHLDREMIDNYQSHPSDTVRGWICYAIGSLPKLKLKERLQLIRPYADDPHFGVREWAWMAIRNHIAKNITQAISAFKPWTLESSANLRRFGVEATRPRGVWCSHIEQLKLSPQLGLPLLEALKGDAVVYVQDSVANWLNDAGKSQPDWVRGVCKRWREESTDLSTERICKRAMRNLKV